MLATIKSYLSDFSHLIFPHNCEGCGTDVLNDEQLLCAECLHQLPETNFIDVLGNPVEKIFYGRLNIAHAAAGYYFSKESLVQHLIHQLKYKNNKEVGEYLGKLLGYKLQASTQFKEVDVLVPLPLNPKREFKRGYNQAAAICEGIAAIWNKPIVKNIVMRSVFTETQTQQSRIHRLQNMQGVFAVENEAALAGKHILLVDDIVTTGATLEACGSVILQNIPNAKLSIITIAYTV